jgi:hypothetical protein
VALAPVSFSQLQSAPSLVASSIKILPLKPEDPKLQENEVSEVIQSLAPPVIHLMEATQACYLGRPVDPISQMPVTLIGPAEHEILPDSRERHLMWVAALSLIRDDLYDFIGKIPGVDIVKRVDEVELIRIPGTKKEFRKDCFDEAFEKEDWYQSALQSSDKMAFMKRLAFRCSSPIPFLKRLEGYKQVQRGGVGDLVVYFSLAGPANAQGIPVYKAKRTVNHFGKVVEIENDGAVIVQSKFRHSHVYRHRIELIPYFFGSGYLFFSRKPHSDSPDFKSNT